MNRSRDGRRRAALGRRLTRSVWFAVLGVLLWGSHAGAQDDCDKAQQYFDQAEKLPWSLANEFKKEELYRKTVTLCPSNGRAFNNLGDVYERQGRFSEAITAYQESARLTGAAVPHFGVADVYFKTDRPNEALEWYEKGLKLEPGDKMSAERAAICRDLLKSPLVSADTIRSVLGPDRAATRGPGEVVSITFGETLIPFDFDSAAILPRARPQLDEIGKALTSMAGGGMEVAGHTDLRGADTYNLGLSDRRAGAIVDYLEKNFRIPRGRLLAKGYGKRVPICTVDSSEACHALNRRVELARRAEMPPPAEPAVGHVSVPTRAATVGVSFRETFEPDITLDAGFFSQSASGRVARLTDESRLRSQGDRYFLFFRPQQDCYAYVLQEDAAGKRTLLYPSESGNAMVRKGNDYWVPRFGAAYLLDNQVGDEVLYLVATSWPLEADLEGVLLVDRVQQAIPGLSRSPIVKAVPPASAPQSIAAGELRSNPSSLNVLLEKIRGQGGWVNVVRFKHEK